MGECADAGDMLGRDFHKEVFKIAIPVALQSMLQSSFSMVDQIMVGQLGEESIAAVEIAGKPSFIYAFVIGAIGAIAGIMISQYIGKKDRVAEEKAICVNFLVLMITAMIFSVLACVYSLPFMKPFTDDILVINEGNSYLKIIGFAFVPLGISNICGVALRCRDKSSWPLYVGSDISAFKYTFKLLFYFWKVGSTRAEGTRRSICKCDLPDDRCSDHSHYVFLAVWGASNFAPSCEKWISSVFFHVGPGCGK